MAETPFLLKEFEAAFFVSDGERDKVSRRFLTLFIDASNARQLGANGYVLKARNIERTCLAVKRLHVGSDPMRTPNAFPEELPTTALKAFRAEYEAQRHLSGINGFPKLYGYGIDQEGLPLIIMEWVEGVSLTAFLRENGQDGRLSWDIAASLGRSIFETLATMQLLDSKPVHRDLSPSNLIIRTSKISLEEQVAARDFDLVLIDFGSMTAIDEYDSRFTTTENILRRATPEYAPPEMLTDCLPGIVELRQSPSIDVYASCSILYEMAAGTTPFSLFRRQGESPYEIKAHEAPRPLEAQGRWRVLADAILRGLSPEQSARPTAQELAAICQQACGRSLTAALAPHMLDADTDFFVASALSPEEGGANLTTSGQAASSPSAPTLSRRGFIAATVGGIAAIALGGFGASALLRVTDRQDPGESASSDDALPSMPQEDIDAGNQLFPVKDPTTTLWGYMNKQGTWAIEPAFMNAGLFSEGVACVTEDNVTMRFINPSGGYAIDKSLDIVTNNVHTVSFSESLATITGSDSKTPGVDYRVGVINMNGDWIIEPTYAGIGRFHQGLAAFCYDSKSKWGYLDASGQIVISSRFYTAESFTDDKLAVAAAGNNQYGWIYANGGWVGTIEPTYAFTGAFSEGLASFVSTSSPDLYGFANTSGFEVIPPTFKGAHCFKSGKCPAQDVSTGLWGLIDTDASWTLKPQYADMGWFHNGLVAVKDATSGLYGYINSDGEVAIPLRYLNDESTGLA